MTSRIAIYCLLIVGQGCTNSMFGGTSTGNAMEMGVDSSASEDEEVVTRSESGAVFTIQSATANVDRIAFPLKSLVGCDTLELASPLSCDPDGEGIEITGERQVDLLAGAFDPALDDLTLPAQTFENLEVELTSMQVTGEFPYDNTVLSFSIDVPFSEAFEFGSEDGVELEDNQTLKMMMDAADWLEDVPVIACIQARHLEIIEGNVDITDGCNNALETLEDTVPTTVSLRVE